jgi:hypothetical protein
MMADRDCGLEEANGSDRGAYALALWGVQPPSGTVTFLFTDVVARRGCGGSRRHGQAIARHDGLLNGAIEARRLRVRNGRRWAGGGVHPGG